MCSKKIPVELEGVWAVSVGCFFFQTFGKVDDTDSLERAFLDGCWIRHQKLTIYLDTDTTTDAQLFRNL
jgi:hypothetical protein